MFGVEKFARMIDTRIVLERSSVVGNIYSPCAVIHRAIIAR